MTGARLDPDEVAKARREEIKYFIERGVYAKVSKDECWDVTGQKPIGVRWVDITKGDREKLNYRSR